MNCEFKKAFLANILRAISIITIAFLSRTLSIILNSLNTRLTNLLFTELRNENLQYYNTNQLRLDKLPINRAQKPLYERLLGSMKFTCTLKRASFIHACMSNVQNLNHSIVKPIFCCCERATFVAERFSLICTLKHLLKRQAASCLAYSYRHFSLLIKIKTSSALCRVSKFGIDWYC
ncbi:hypothetical protein T05_3707 [Trichinella murrelli]|uniref:Uncharacterized protein n=1 Tax=Trichinella murrelli TaxID=144512 RepID=A0A0V0TLF0_9BILA|nr:hypothetical protein T05_3707 [Trichinella murrelli]